MIRKVLVMLHRTRNLCVAVSLDGDFIIERTYEPHDLSIPRPQNPEQYANRLRVISSVIYSAIGLGERYAIRVISGDGNSTSTLFCIIYGLYCFKQQQWVERALKAFVGRAWIATYQPDWNPNGP